MSDTDLSAVFGLPFEEQVRFFRDKLGDLVPTATWRDLMREAHDRAFMVAGAAKADLLADLAAAVDKAISDGEGIDAFRKRFRDIVQRHGWHGWTGEGSTAGTNWRTRIIYHTNMSTSYAAGRLSQLQHFPIWVYRHSGSPHPRLQHKAWDGLTLPSDHPFWQTHYPPNGWHCGCRVVGVRTRDAAGRVGGQPDYDAPPAGWDQRDAKGNLPGIPEGWDYMPGGTWHVWDRHAYTPECPTVSMHGRLSTCIRAVDGQRSYIDFGRQRIRDIDDMLRIEAPALLPKAASREAALEQSAASLGVSAAQPRRWIDTEVPALPRVVVDYNYLAHMVEKDNDARERYANFILPTLITPYEVWSTLYSDGTIRPRLISLFRGKHQIVVILRINKDGSLFYNVMNANDKRIDDFRRGELLYGR